VLFVSAARTSIIRNQVWGAPDLVVEVLSESSQDYDRGEKQLWYRQYGVREYWRVELYRERVTVVDFTLAAPEDGRTFLVKIILRLPIQKTRSKPAATMTWSILHDW